VKQGELLKVVEETPMLRQLVELMSQLPPAEQEKVLVFAQGVSVGVGIKKKEDAA